MSARSSPARPFSCTATRAAVADLSIAVRFRLPAQSASTAVPTFTDMTRISTTLAGPPLEHDQQALPRSASWARRPLLLGLVARGVGGERGDEGLLGHLDAADHLHPLLAFLLLLQ